MRFDGSVDPGQDGGDVQEPEDFETRLRRGVVVIDHGGHIVPALRRTQPEEHGVQVAKHPDRGGSGIR